MNTETMEHSDFENCQTRNILDVLWLDHCASAIFEHVPVRDLVRSERVSHRWQCAVHEYLRSQRTLTVINLLPETANRSVTETNLHRSITINLSSNFWPQIHNNILVKWGPSIVKVVTACCDDEYWDTIASHCPHLRYLEFHLFRKHPPLIKLKNCEKLKDMSLKVKEKIISDKQLSEIFQNIDWENIKIGPLDILATGDFLKSVNSCNLQSLRFETSHSLNINALHSSIDKLRNLTCLGLDNGPMSLLENIHLLLNEMPKLEELSLRSYSRQPLSEEVIRSFGQLGNLKRLDMKGNKCVNDAFLEEIARGCRKLEYLNLCGITNDGGARGLAALCRRASSITTLHVAYAPSLIQGQVVFSWYPSVVQELVELGCVQIRTQFLETADSSNWHPYELRAVGNARSSHHNELEIIMADVKQMNELNRASLQVLQR